jgi:hypothetical protein
MRRDFVDSLDDKPLPELTPLSSIYASTAIECKVSSGRDDHSDRSG